MLSSQIEILNFALNPYNLQMQKLFKALISCLILFALTQQTVVSLDCSALGYQFSTERDDVCICPAGQAWHYGKQLCETSDCITDAGSTGLILPNNECQCLEGFYWNKDLQTCYANCNQELAMNPEPTNPQRCVCRQTAVWSERESKCVLNCPAQRYSTGQQQSHEVCECVLHANWNPAGLVCELSCLNVPYSTGVWDDANSRCLCQADHSWMEESLSCVRDCPSDHYTTGVVLENDQCECVAGAKWNFYLQKCTALDCGEIAYATGISADYLSCICESDFIWNPVQYLCVIDCASLAHDPLGTHENTNSYECGCQLNTAWNLVARKCEWECDKIGNSTAVQTEGGLSCECNLGFDWNAAGSCDRACGDEAGQTGYYDEAERHCQCYDAYAWSYEMNACWRVCDNHTFALPQEGPTATSCYCFNGFHWDSTEVNCKIDCDGEFDVGVASESTCQCEPNSYFSSRQRKCLVNCNNDQLSTHVFTVDRCQCKANAHWNSGINQCECIEGFTMNAATQNCESSSASSVTMGVLGGAIFSGTGMFVGMHIYHKRKRERENEKQVNLGTEAAESNKEIVVSEGV